MLSPGSSLLECGLAALSGVSGEQLGYHFVGGSLSIVATVDRNVVRGREFVEQFKGGEGNDFSALNMSRIELRKADLTRVPAAGECFLDGYSYRHRVRAVVQTDITWVCWCQPSLFIPKVPKGNLVGAGGDEILDAGGGNVGEA